MVMLSRERVESVARALVDAMSRSSSVKFLKDREAVRQAIAYSLADEIRREENVRKRIASMKKAPPRGSAEWDALFRSLMNEEYLRDGEA